MQIVRFFGGRDGLAQAWQVMRVPLAKLLPKGGAKVVGFGVNCAVYGRPGPPV